MIRNIGETTIVQLTTNATSFVDMYLTALFYKIVLIEIFFLLHFAWKRLFLNPTILVQEYYTSETIRIYLYLWKVNLKALHRSEGGWWLKRRSIILYNIPS